MNKSIALLVALFACNLSIAAQDVDEILNQLETSNIDNTVTATFKATRILNGHSIERMPHGQLDFRIHHRFGTLNSGAYNFWGIDAAQTQFSLEYGITDWLMAGLSRGSYEKTYGGFLKFSLFRQKQSNGMPVSISYLTASTIRSQDFPFIDSLQNNDNYPFSSRLAYVHQLLIARKFSNRLSLQVSPVLIHYNMVSRSNEPNNIFALGVGGRIKLTTRTSFNFEYYPRLPSKGIPSQYTDALSFGFDIETGGHVFQLILTNTQGMIEKDFIGRTTGKWNKGDIHFGFNISRVFTIKH
ncbi:MAG: DUF5777 family beta-barrel protein [Bacteroidales bacterium]|nr:DUF5777 family beta-barrel protein [Bacteroidales bacterium]